MEFLLTFWSQVKSLELCYSKFSRLIQSQARQLNRAYSTLSVLEKVFSARKRLLHHATEAFLLKLEAAIFLSTVNRHGFLNLLEQLEERCMEPGPSAHYRERLLACHFILDCQSGGPLAVARDDAAALLAQLAAAPGAAAAAALRGAIGRLRLAPPPPPPPPPTPSTRAVLATSA